MLHNKHMELTPLQKEILELMEQKVQPKGFTIVKEESYFVETSESWLFVYEKQVKRVYTGILFEGKPVYALCAENGVEKLLNLKQLGFYILEHKLMWERPYITTKDHVLNMEHVYDSTS